MPCTLVRFSGELRLERVCCVCFLILKVTRTRRLSTAFYGGSNVDLDTKQYVSLRLLLFQSLFENNEKQLKRTIQLVNDT